MREMGLPGMMVIASQRACHGHGFGSLPLNPHGLINRSQLCLVCKTVFDYFLAHFD